VIPFSALAVFLAAASASQPAARVVVGPNILVSRDGDFPHCETWIAANPKDPKNLVGAATTLSQPPDGSFMNRTYASHDGGSTWTAATLPIEVENGGGDPQVGYLADGTALFVGIGKFGMAVHRSPDGGITWEKPVVLKFADHEQLAVDHTVGRFAGRVYLAGEAGEKASTKERVSRVVLYRSDDGGRSFVGPVTVARSPGTGLAVHPLAVLSDGTLVVPLLRYPNPAQDKTTPVHSVECAVSTDGGVTFSAPRKIGDFYFGGYAEFMKRKASGRIDQMSGLMLAASPAGPYRDRLYAVWTDFHEVPRLVVSVSKDSGSTWSAPRPIDPNGRAGSSQYQPMLAANGNGAVGVLWYDTRDFPKRDRYDVYFAASTDGGESFTPAIKVSSQPSNPTGPGNVRAVPLGGWDAADPAKPIAMDFYSAFSSWPDGGDYCGMAVDADGVFHPLWSDSRGGTFQLYTARIEVVTEAEKKDKATRTHIPTGTAEQLNGRVVLAYDPVAFDAATNELAIPVRLRNESKEPVFGPLRVEVKDTVLPALVESHSEELVSRPSILNASNGKAGVGAVFDYSHSLGTEDVLEPGEVSDAIVWKVRVEEPAKTMVHFGVEITGFMAVAKEGNTK